MKPSKFLCTKIDINTLLSVKGLSRMKKKITFLLSLAAVLSSCSNGNIKQKEQYKREIDGLIDYGNIVDNKASVIFSENINLDGVRLFSKNNKKTTKNFICGEKLEVYYKTSDYEEIDYAILDSDDLVCIELTNAPIPGSNKMDIFPVQSRSELGGLTIGRKNIDYVINGDGSFTSRDELKMFSKLWGVYKKEDIEVVEINDHLGYRTFERVELTAVYSFDITNDIE